MQGSAVMHAHLQRSMKALAVCLAVPAAALAQGSPEREFFWGAEAGVEYTDNVGRSSVDEQSETVGIGAFSLGLLLDRPRLDTDIGVHVEYRDYLDDAFDSEIVGGVDGLLTYSFIPERFTWTVTDNFGQISNERTAVDSPDNRQNTNHLSTGPDIILPLTTRSSLTLSGRYTDTYYENTPEDSEALTGSLALARRMSDFSTLSLNGSTTEVEYDVEAFGKYRIDQGFLRWATESERTSFSLDAGYNAIDQDGETSDGLLARLALLRAVTARSSIGLTAGTEFVTSGGAFRQDQDITGIETGADDAIASRDPLQLDYAYLTWTTDWGRSSFNAGLNARSETHEIAVEDDRDLYGASLGMARAISRRLDASLFASYQEEKLAATDFTFDEWSVGLGFSWALSERISLALRLEHFEGSSDDGSRDFDENRGYVGLTYTRGS